MSDQEQKHLILRQIFDLYLNDRSLAKELQAFVKSESDLGIRKALEAALDRMETGAEWIRIDRIEIDLGEMEPADFRRELPYILERAFYQALTERLGRIEMRQEEASVMGDSRRVPTEARWEAFVHFLRFGIPSVWWQGRGSMQALLTELLERSTPRLPLGPRLKPLLKDKSASVRLMQAIRKEDLPRLQAVLYPKKLDRLEEYVAFGLQLYNPQLAQLPRDLYAEYLRRDILEASMEMGSEWNWTRFEETLEKRLLSRVQSQPEWEVLLRKSGPIESPDLLTFWEATVASESARDAESQSTEEKKNAAKEESGLSPADKPAQGKRVAEPNKSTESKEVGQAESRDSGGKEKKEPETPYRAALSRIETNLQGEQSWTLYWDAFSQGLSQGRIPWWSVPQSWESLVTALVEKADRFRQQWPIWLRQQSPAAQGRMASLLASELPLSSQQKLIQSWNPELSGWIETVRLLLAETDPEQFPKAKPQFLWESALLLGSRSAAIQSQAFLAEILQRVASGSSGSARQELSQYWVKLARKLSQAGQGRFRPLVHMLPQIARAPLSPSPDEEEPEARESAPDTQPSAEKAVTPDEEKAAELAEEKASEDAPEEKEPLPDGRERPRSDERQESPPEPPTPAEDIPALFRHFFTHVSLPEEDQGLSAADLVERLREWWNTEKDTWKGQQWLRRKLEAPGLIPRLVAIFPDQELRKLNKLLAPDQTDTWWSWIERWDKPWLASHPDMRASLLAYMLEIHIRQPGASPIPDRWILSVLQRSGRTSGGKPVRESLKAIIEQLDASADRQIQGLLIQLKQSLVQIRKVPDPPAPRTDKPRPKRKPLPGDLPIYIQNAGLVLVWPMLSHFFNLTALLVDKKNFKDEIHQQRAIHLLQYLVDKRSDAPEEDLFLNKIMVSWPETAPIVEAISMSEEEVQKAEELLTVVRSRWKPLKASSNDGLRGSFLIRPGKLFRKNQSWVLQVERKAYDVLLDSLPWTLSMVKFPWMEGYISVEWA